MALEGRTKILICRCGASKRQPLCDGAHNRTRFEADDVLPASVDEALLGACAALPGEDRSDAVNVVADVGTDVDDDDDILFIDGLGADGSAPAPAATDADVAACDVSRRLLEDVDLPAIILDETGKVLFANDSIARIIGVPRDMLLGFQYSPDDTSHLQTNSPREEFVSLARGQRDRSVYEDLLPGPAGPTHVRWHSVALRAPGKQTLVASIGENLNEANRIAATLSEVERVAQIGHWIWDVELQKLTWSDTVFGIFGLDPLGFSPAYDTFMGRVHEDDRQLVIDGVAAAVHSGDLYDVQHRIVRPDGGVRWVRERAEVRRRLDGAATRMVGTVQDMTAMVAAQHALQERDEQLRQSQKMEALGALAGGIAHDFNNLLSVILGFSSLLVDDNLPAEVSYPVGQICNAAKRAQGLTKQLLAFSRQQVVHPVSTDLAAIARDFGIIADRLLGEQIQWDLRVHTRPQVNVDPVQMEQLLLNLAINARDAMPRGGTLTCSITSETVDEAHRCADDVPRGEYAVLTLQDTGTGIDPMVRARMFEPFITTKTRGRGTGLGLATVYGIVQQSHGHICVESAPQQGTTFSIYLPIHHGEAKAVALPRRLTPPTSREPVVLVVEDEDDVREVTCTILRRRGFTVFEANGGPSALKILDGTRVDLLLCDVVMPGMSGPELVSLLVHHYPDLPVLFMTGYTDDIAFHHGVELGNVQVVNKPLAADHLIAAVHDALQSAPPLQSPTPETTS